VSFSSQIRKGERIIDDEPQSMQFAFPNGIEFGKGLDLGLRGPGDFEYGDLALPFPKELLLSWAEIEERIKEMEETKSRISDLIYSAKLPHKDQSSTNFCWINAPTHDLEISRLQQNQKPVILSPASGGAIIKNFRNVGGWGKEALDFIRLRGLNDVQDWPANAIDRKYATAENAEKALNYRVLEWMECVPRNSQQMLSLLCRRCPGAGGYNWWGHEITVCDPMWIDGEPAIRIRNSWKNWGEFGFGILRGSKMLADDLVFVVSSLAA
jgi:hypothetical protein